jgi:phosphoribosylformylglycinamidine synthase
MTPYETMLSESQERMLLVAEKGREQEVFDVFKKWGLDAVTVGFVTDDGKLRVRDHGEVVAEIRNHDLAEEAPIYDRPHGLKPYRKAPMEAPEFSSEDLAADLVKLVSSGDLCAKDWIWEQYDYMVRTNTTQGPGADAAVVRIKETGNSIAMSLDGNERYTYLDPREGTKLMVAESCRNLSVVGAQPMAATNNLNFGNPERPEIMAQLVESIEGMAEACEFFGTPITGGNVSLYNETLGEPVKPSPVMGIVGILKTEAPMPIHFQNAGRKLLLLGGLGAADEQRFGGTQYAKAILDDLWGLPPALDMDYEKRVHDAMREIVRKDAAESAHDLSGGGLGVALAESSFGPNGIGASVLLDTGLRNELALFHEGPSRILISTDSPEKIESIAKKHNVELLALGSTQEGLLTVSNRGTELVRLSVDELRSKWQTALPTKLGSTAG